MASSQQALFTISMASGSGTAFAKTYATWDPLFVPSGGTLSGGNLNFALAASPSATRSTIAKTSGKWYWEEKWGSIGAGPTIGIANSSFSSGWPGHAGSDSYGWDSPGGLYFNGSSVSGVPASYTSADTLGFALDLYAGTLSLYKNNVFQFTQTVGVNTWFAAVGNSGGITTTNVTANYGASALTYTPPTGYSAGLFTTGYTYATWNPNDKNASITLSTGNMTATVPTVVGLARASLGKSSGKWYWEVTGAAGNGPIPGISTTSTLTSTWPGGDTTSYGYYSQNGSIYNNGSVVGGLGTTYISTDVIGFALDMTVPSISFYKNNVLAGTQTISAGTWYPSVGQSGGAVGCTAVINCGESPMVYTAPGGYNQGFYSAFNAWNPADASSSYTFGSNNRSITTSTINTAVRSVMFKTSGKWYWEVTCTSVGDVEIGIATKQASLSTTVGLDAFGWSYAGSNGHKINNGSSLAYGSTYTTGDVIGIALDLDGGTLTFYKNNVSQGVAYSGGFGGVPIYAAVGVGAAGSQTVTANFGETAFTYSPPGGYNAGFY
jgi:hypothetical protein